MTPEEIQQHVDNRIDARLEEVAELAAKKALEHVYADIGRGLLRKVAWLMGVAVIALLSWMAGKGMRLPSP
jgi:hypothetical protein